jgi:acetone carboxylase gamma subunit
MCLFRNYKGEETLNLEKWKTIMDKLLLEQFEEKKYIHCSCGHSFEKKYNEMTIVSNPSNHNKNVYLWMCGTCGQQWIEELKEPKIIK